MLLHKDEGVTVRAVITSSPPAWTSSAGVLSTPADFPSHGETWAKYNLTEPIPLPVKHVAVEFIVNPSAHLALVFKSFKYLGSVITDEGSKPEILSRIA